MSNVLLVINEEAHARELSRVADYLLKNSDLRPVYFVEDRMKPLGVHTKLAGGPVEILTSDGFVESSQKFPEMTVRSIWRRWANAAISCMPYFIEPFSGVGTRALMFFRQIISERSRLLRHSKLCDAVIAQRPYAALVLSEDNVELDSSIWIETAHKHAIRCVIIPFTVANTIEFLEAYAYSKPNQLETTEANQIIARLFPKWRAQHKGRDFIRSGFAKVAAFELLGLTPPNPWLLNSGYADAIAVESPAMFDYYRAAGLPAKQLVTTGSMPDDVIADVIANAAHLRRELLEENGLPLNRPILLCAFPPNDNRYDRPGVEFSDFDEQLEFWGQSFAAVRGWNVIVVPHPKTKIERLDALRNYNLTLSRRDTVSLIPLCDLYVASASATIRWALSCAKPVINFDVFQLDLRDYDHLKGVVLAKTREDFRRALVVLTGDPAEFARIKAIQEGEAPRWGFRDGQSGRQLLALLHGEPVATPSANVDAT